MDTAVVSERKGLVLAEYNVSMEWRVTDTISIQDIELRLNCRAFLTEESKVRFITKPEKEPYGYQTASVSVILMEVVSENAKKFIQECLFTRSLHSVLDEIYMFEKVGTFLFKCVYFKG